MHHLRHLGVAHRPSQGQPTLRFLGLQGLKSLDLSRKRWIFCFGQQQMMVVEVVKDARMNPVFGCVPRNKCLPT
jgi:hypothetical protein